MNRSCLSGITCVNAVQLTLTNEKQPTTQKKSRYSQINRKQTVTKMIYTVVCLSPTAGFPVTVTLFPLFFFCFLLLTQIVYTCFKSRVSKSWLLVLPKISVVVAVCLLQLNSFVLMILMFGKVNLTECDSNADIGSSKYPKMFFRLFSCFLRSNSIG